MNILITIESFFDGGAEMFAIRLANELGKHHQVYFLELYPYLTTLKKQKKLIETDKVKLYQAGRNFLGNWLFEAKNWKGNKNKRIFLSIGWLYNTLKDWQIKCYIKYHHITVVNSHSWDTDVYFSAIKEQLSIRLIATFHGHYEFLADKRQEFVTRTFKTLSKIDGVIYTAPSHTTTLDRFNYPLHLRKKIFYGFSSNVTKQVTQYFKEDFLEVGLVSRCIKEKGWEEAILAVLYLNKKYNNRIRLTLAGEGDFANYLKNTYNAPCVYFCGYVHNVAEVIQQMHVCLLPSYYTPESLPNSVIEYLVNGKPVIATNVGAVPEMISYGEEIGGFCLDIKGNKDLVQSLASALETYLIQPELVSMHSQIAMKAAAKFSMENCTSNYLSAYSNN